MRYAELEGSRVRYVLPAKLADKYKVLPPKSIEIPLDADVQQGDKYDPETKGFSRPTEEELKAKARPVFDTERDRRFRETDWMKERYAEKSVLTENGKLPQEKLDTAKTKYLAVLEYRQALRNMPDQPDFDPRNPQWPKKPE